MSATTDDIIELLRKSTAIPAGPFDVTQARVDGSPFISGDVKGRTQDMFGRFNAMDQFAYDQELQGRDNFGGGISGFTNEQDVLDYFTRPGLTPQDAVQTMQYYNIQPEDIASILGLTPEAARSQYNAALAPFAQATAPATTAPVTTPPATTPPADDAGVLDLLRTGATRVGEVIDRGLMAVGDFFRNAPQLVVLNPVNPSATVVFGTPSGTTTPTIIGSMPTSGAPIGVATGNPLIDAVLSKVFSKRAPGQSGPDWATVVKEAVLEEIGNQTGYDIGSVVGAAQGGLDADVQRVIDSATKVVLGVNEEVDKFDKNNPTLDTIGAEKIPGDVTTTDTEEIFGVPGTAGETSVETDTNQLIDLIGGPGPDMGPNKVIDLIGDPGPDMGPNKVIDLIGGPGPDMGPIRTTTTTTPVTGTDTDDLINLIGGPGPDMGPIKTTATDTTKKKVDDTTVTDDTTKKKVDDITVVEEDDTKKKVDDITVVEEDDTKKVVSPDGPVTPPKVVSPGSLNIPGVVTPTTPAPQQGVRMERTKKAGLAEIDPEFELNASLLDNLLRILSSEDDNSAGVPYYRGGKVAPYADIDEIIRLLRG